MKNLEAPSYQRPPPDNHPICQPIIQNGSEKMLLMNELSCYKLSTRLEIKEIILIIPKKDSTGMFYETVMLAG